MGAPRQGCGTNESVVSIFGKNTVPCPCKIAPLSLGAVFPKDHAFGGSSHIGIEEFAQRLQSLPKVRKYLVYGSEDTDFDVDVPAMSALACENLEIVVLDGVNHEFTDRLEDFVALIDLI